MVTNSEIVLLDPAAQLAREIAAPDAPAYVNSLAVGGAVGTVTAWNPRSGKRIGAPIRLTEPNTRVAQLDPGLGVQGVAFDARGRTLVASTTSGRVAVIDPKLWTVRRTFQLVDDAIEFLNPLAISPDGRTVALAGPRVVAMSDINGTHRRQVHVGPVRATAVAFQPDGRRLGAVVEDGRILVIDPTTARVRTTLVSNFAISLAFNRTGTTLATGHPGDGSVVLWNLADGQPLGPPLASSQQGTVVETLTFSANGDSVFAGSSNGSLVHHRLASSQWADRLCAVIGRNLTPNERDAYLADSNAGRRTCPNWPVAP